MWEEIDTGAGPPEFSTLIQTGFMNLTGTGSATAIALMTADHEAIYVEALPNTPAVGTEAGVTVRRSDSPDSLSFWWLGGTSYELRKGSTVLESIVGPGAGAIKLEIVSPRAGTTDVNCYVGGALVHTESAVAFTLPDVLNLGMASIGSAAFDWFESSPCPKSCHSSPCDRICEQAYNSLCSEAAANIPAEFDLPLLPVSWETELEITGVNAFGQCCSRYGGKIAFVYGENVAVLGFQPSNQPCPDTFPPTSNCDNCEIEVWGTDPALGTSTCGWHGIISSRYPGPDHRAFCSAFDSNNNLIASFRHPRTPVPSGKFPWWGPSNCNRPDGDDAPDTTTFLTDIGMVPQPTNERWMIGVSVHQVGPGTVPSDFEVKVTASLENITFGGGGTVLRYESAQVALDVVDLVNGPTTLSLTVNNTDVPCVIPPTITLIPNGNRAVAGEVTQCWDVDICDPPLDPVAQAVYTMTASFEDLSGNVFSEDVTMVAHYNEETASWEWNGIGGGFTHPTCGAIPPNTYRIYCREEGEGEIRRWMISVDNSNGTVELPMTMDSELGPSWSGTIDNQCSGEDWESLIDNLHQPVPAQFGSCTSVYEPMKLEGNVQYVCFFSPESAQADITLSAIPNTSIPGTLPGPILGSVWRGTIPFGHGFHVYVYATSTTGFNLVITHLDGTLLSGGSTVGTYHCGGANNRPVLEDVFIPTGWGDEPDPTGICSGTFGNAEWAFIWDGFKFYGE